MNIRPPTSSKSIACGAGSSNLIRYVPPASPMPPKTTYNIGMPDSCQMATHIMPVPKDKLAGRFHAQWLTEHAQRN